MTELSEAPESEQYAFYTVRLPIDLAESKNVELVFESTGNVCRQIDGHPIGAWVRAGS